MWCFSQMGNCVDVSGFAVRRMAGEWTSGGRTEWKSLEKSDLLST